MKLKRFIRNIGYSFSDMLDEVGTFIHVQWDRYCLPFIHNRKNMFIALVISVIAIILFLFISIIFHLNPHNINWAISFVWFINIWSG
jgi:MFS superfamily sulfate permease-like transporter